MEEFYNSAKFRIVLRVKEAVYTVYFTGTMANSTTVRRKPRKISRPARKLLPNDCNLINIT